MCGEASRAETDTRLGTTGERSQGKEAGLAYGSGRGGAGPPLGPQKTHIYAWHWHGIPFGLDEATEDQSSDSGGRCDGGSVPQSGL